MTDPMVEFVLARIAEDRATAEHAAKESGDPAWEWDGSPIGSVGPRPMGMAVDLYSDVGAHVARWDPAHVLAECEAKRRMIEDLVAESTEHWGPRESPEREWEWCPKVRTREFCAHTDLEWGPDAPCECAVEWPDYRRMPLLRYFTLPYVDHPDCREEWLP